MKRVFEYQIGDGIESISVEREDKRFTVRVGDRVLHLTARAGDLGRLDLEVENRRLRVYAAAGARGYYINLNGETWLVAKPDPRQRRRTASGAAGGGRLDAAMPGRVLDLLVREGDRVSRGDTLVLLEAMKMELRVQAPQDGHVARIHVAAGQVVERGQLLVEMGEMDA